MIKRKREINLEEKIEKESDKYRLRAKQRERDICTERKRYTESSSTKERYRDR